MDRDEHGKYWNSVNLSRLATMHVPLSQHNNVFEVIDQFSPNFSPYKLDVSIEHSLFVQICTLAEQHNTTLAAVVLTCWHILFASYRRACLYYGAGL